MPCELCGRDTRTTEHHLVPRARRRKERERFGDVAQICRDCHTVIHATWDNKSLARDYASIDRLRAAPELQRYLKWIRKQPGSVRFRHRSRRS